MASSLSHLLTIFFISLVLLSFTVSADKQQGLQLQNVNTYPPSKAPVTYLPPTPPVKPYTPPPVAPAPPVVAPYVPPPKTQAPPVVTPPTPYRPPVKKADCVPLCEARCKLHSRTRVCMRACSTCCERCKCVPPGTYGNREVCGTCWTEMRTHGDRYKCP